MTQPSGTNLSGREGTGDAAGAGSAGPRGEDVRSDCFVLVEPRASGGIALDLRSKVEPYYGASLRAQIRDALAALGIAHARVAVEDQGALPFTLDARLEAAVRRAGAAGDRRVLPGARRDRPVTPRDRLRRSRLYLPGSQPRFFVNAGLHGADAVILDLEDSVHPREKDAARILVRNALRVLDFGGAERMVRINQAPLGLTDLAEILPERPDVVLIPKVEHPDQVAEVDRAVEAACQGASDPGPWLMPILESALGVEHAFAIAGASPRVVALTIGVEDYTADLGVVKTTTGEETLYARSRLVNAARAARVQAIDSVYGDVTDMEGLLAYGRRSRALGFEGMGCLHPAQIRVIHRAYAPSEEEIARAAAVVEAYEAARAVGLGVVSLGSKMIDPPVVERALRLVRTARAMGLLAAEGGAWEAGKAVSPEGGRD